MQSRFGDKSSTIGILQKGLQDKGYEVTINNVFDVTTLNAVKKFQKDNNLLVDGIIGERTLSLLFKNNNEVKSGEPKWLSESDISNAADSINVETAMLKAIIKTEAPKGGFLGNGKVVILFERHWFYKLLTRKHGNKPLVGISASIYSKTPGGYLGGTYEYDRLNDAIKIDEEIAYQSASYGRFQIMGFNYEKCGFSSAKEMYERLSISEGEQLRALVRFLSHESNVGLLNAIRNKNFALVAKLYNGSNYAINKYDLKLKTNYKLYSSSI